MNSPSEGAIPSRLLASAIASDRDFPHVEEVIALFGSLRRPLMRYTLTLGLAVCDGEEIIQETFLALFKHLKSGKSRENLPGWVFRVCHNLSLKQIEKTRVSQTGIVDEIDWLNQLANNLPNPEEQLLQTQRHNRLQSVLRALPEQDRCCIALRAEGLRYREIAEILGISLGSVAASLTRSLSKFERADQD
jgi:RNA polymerase sigma-70 factor (ECF subfamily)